MTERFAALDSLIRDVNSILSRVNALRRDGEGGAYLGDGYLRWATSNLMSVKDELERAIEAEVERTNSAEDEPRQSSFAEDH